MAKTQLRATRYEFEETVYASMLDTVEWSLLKSATEQL